MAKSSSVAAYVNDQPIYEDDVTDFIEGFRKKKSQYETDIGWAEFLRSNGFTSESIRTYVLNTVFIPQELIRQECASRGIQITDAQLDKVIAQEKEYYEKRYGGSSWDSVLASFGYDQDSWRTNELNRLLEEELRTIVIGDVEPSNGEIQVLANESASAYNGKSSYFISFNSEQDAQQARTHLAFPANLQEFNTLGEVQYAGWNSLPAYRDTMSKEYEHVLSTLDVGDVSSPVQVGGSWLLIFCDAVFNVGVGGESVSLRSIPDLIYNQIASDAAKEKSNRLFNDWLDKKVESSSIQIEPIPDHLPYSVNVMIEDQ